jgi:hypothetical protein
MSLSRIAAAPVLSTALNIVLFSLACGIAFAQSLATPAANPPTAMPGKIFSVSRNIAQVDYSNGQITVAANNSSLNQILHSIARKAGIRVTGSIPDQPVFGNYGPAAPATILASLLEGTGSNMLLTPATPDTAAQLILTPRQGGPTPPDPVASVTPAQLPSQTTLPAQLGSASTSQQGFALDTSGHGAQPADPNNAPPLLPLTPSQISDRIHQMQAMQHTH